MSLQVKLDSTVLSVVPRNWETIVPRFQLDNVYRTVSGFRTFKPLEFVKDGADFVRAVYAAAHTEGSTTITIQELVNFQWQDYLIAELDYADYDDQGTYVVVGVKPSTLEAKWKKSDQIRVAYNDLEDLDENAITAFANESYQLPLFSQPVEKFYIGETLDQDEETEIIVKPFQLGGQDEQLNEIPDNGFSIPCGFAADVASITPVLEHVDEIDQDYEVIIDYDIDYDLENNQTDPGLSIKLNRRFYDHDAASNNDSELEIDGGGAAVSGNFTGTDTLSISAKAATDVDNSFVKYYLSFGGTGTPPGSLSFGITVNKFKVTIKKQSTFKETTCTAVPIWELLTRMAQKITGLSDPIRSSLFGRTDSPNFTYGSDGAHSLIFATNGAMLRGYTMSEKPLTISFREVFEALNLTNIGIGVREINGTKYIVIERISYFYDSGNLLFTVNEADHVSVVPSRDNIYNQIEFGYKNWEEELRGALDTPHATRVYSTGNNSVKNSYEMVSEAIVSGVKIELIRRQQKEIEPLKDHPDDDKLVFIQCKRDGMGGYEPEQDDDFTSVTGVNFPGNLYNLKLTPARLLLLHACWFQGANSVINKDIKFRSGKANYSMQSQETGEDSITENQDFTTADLDNPLFIPDDITAIFPLSREWLAQLATNPSGYIQVNWKGKTYEGYPIDLAITNIKSKTATTKLLRKYA